MTPADFQSPDVRQRAMQTLFDHFDQLCEGALAVDADARVVWLNDKYKQLLGVGNEVLGKPVEQMLPNSLMRRVVETGRPILLDLMQFGARSFVVIRLPVRNDAGAVIGAVGFVLYDRAEQLKPLMSKFNALQDEIARARRELAGVRRAKYTFSQLLGSSAAMREIKRLGRRAAQMNSTVLLLGETGVGKELLAHAIHAASARADKAMVSVNVAAVPDTLLEAEFFGTAPGAYTGADRKGRDGKFKLADGGTLFLDEIGDMSLPLQAKLLRVLQEGEVEPLGSNRVIRVDVRIIAATSRDLAAQVRAGSFRADLYYRLNVVPITLPPLRERIEDIPDIAESLLERICIKAGIAQPELSRSALLALSAHDWPGNVRELANLLERAVATSDDPVLTADHLRPLLLGTGLMPEDMTAGRRAGLADGNASSAAPESTAPFASPAASPGGVVRPAFPVPLPGAAALPETAGSGAGQRAGGHSLSDSSHLPAAELPRRVGLDDARRQAERQAIESALAQCGGVKARAARLLGISRATLYERLAALDMTPAARTVVP